MCGIVGYVGAQDSREVLLDGLSRLEYRGYDSAGVALVEPNGIAVYKSEGRLQRLRDKLEKINPPRTAVGIGHTRWATHGAPSDINSHPHSAARVSLVHNGIIENYSRLKEYLIGKGYDFVSETDSEVLVKLMDHNYKGNALQAIMITLAQVRGSYGLAILFADEPDRIYAVRKESPLIIAYGDGENFLASDIPAILPYTSRYSVLENGEIAVLSREGIEVYDEFGTAVAKPVLVADFSVEAAEKDGWPHFMLKEINEEPDMILAAVRPRLEDGLPCLNIEGLTEDYLAGVERIHVVACGTAMYAGMVGKYTIEKLARIPVEVHIASEFRYSEPILGPKDLVLIISQSGETIDTLAALRLAKDMGAKTLAIVNVVGSSIARAADWVMYSYGGLEIAVASTKAYTVQLCCLYLFAMQLARTKGRIADEEARRLVAELLRAPELIRGLLQKSEDVQFFASELMNTSDLFFIGRGIDYALSMEGSLKLKEISYIHSEACAAGELKHGPISLITTGTPVVALATQADVLEKTISNVQEVKSRGARVLLFTKEGAHIPEGLGDYVYLLPNYEPILMPLLTVVPLQLFAYYVSLLRGCDIDKPRNLAKSVTVE